MTTFRDTAKKLLRFALLFLLASIVLLYVEGSFWMLLPLGLPPMLFIALAMFIAPGPASAESFEARWVATPRRYRALWIGTFALGFALGLFTWMWTIANVGVAPA